MVENYRCVDLAGTANRAGASVLLGRFRWFVRPAPQLGIEYDNGEVSETIGGELHVRECATGHGSSSTSEVSRATPPSCSSRWGAILLSGLTATARSESHGDPPGRIRPHRRTPVRRVPSGRSRVTAPPDCSTQSDRMTCGFAGAPATAARAGRPRRQRGARRRPRPGRRSLRCEVGACRRRPGYDLGVLRPRVPEPPLHPGDLTVLPGVGSGAASGCAGPRTAIPARPGRRNPSASTSPWSGPAIDVSTDPGRAMSPCQREARCGGEVSSGGIAPCASVYYVQHPMRRVRPSRDWKVVERCRI